MRPLSKKLDLVFYFLLMVLATLLSWIGAFEGTFQSITTLITISVLGVAIWKRSLAPLLIILAGPLAWSFYGGLAEWFKPKPVFWSHGLPGHEFHNLDRQTRCNRIGGGCIVRGNEWIWISPHNYGLRMMTVLVGNPQGAYDGPYPTKDESMFLTKNAPLTAPEIFLSDAITLNSQRMSILPVTAEKILNDAGAFTFRFEDPDAIRIVRSALVDGRCLLIRITHSRYSSEDVSVVIFLFDKKTMKPFARYVIYGESVPRQTRLLSDI